MITTHKSCEGCPFRERGLGFVPGKGPLTARVALIGQGPGKVEIYSGEPFIGPAGQRLDIWLAKANLPRSQMWIDNSVRCRILRNGKDVAPPKAVAQCYQRHWGAALSKLDELEYIVTIGAEASKFIVGPWCGDRAAGTLVEVEL